jgi:protein-tyrosine phosphatase
MKLGILILKSKDLPQRRYVLSGIFSIGRHPENHLEIPESYVSRFHAVVEGEKEGFIIRDLGSKNGTLVNGKRISSHLLSDGDIVQIGEYQLEFSSSFYIEGPEGESVGPFSSAPVVDLHCHILPGLDDGAADFSDAMDMCREAQKDGIKVLVATAHTLNGTYNNPKRRILSSCRTLQKEVQRFGIEVSLFPGAEVRANPILMDLLRSDEVLTLNNGNRFIFIEFPDQFVKHLILRLLYSLSKRDLIPIICHPERTLCLMDTGLIRDAVKLGCLVQITSGSLTNQFGNASRRFSRELLEEGLVHIIASDAHCPRKRPPRLSDAVEEAAKIVGEDEARRLVTVNPCSLLLGSIPPHPARYPEEERAASVDTSLASTSILEKAVSGRKHSLTVKPASFPERAPDETRNGASIAIFSNKGGVGKTHLSINLACALTREGASVLLVDLDLGNGDIANKLSVTPPVDLFDYFKRDRLFADIVLDYGGLFHVVFSKGGEVRLANLNYIQKRRFINDFRKIHQYYDYVIFDLGAGISKNVLDFASGADYRVVVTTPNDVSSAYHCIKAFSMRYLDLERKRIESQFYRAKKELISYYLVFNQARDFKEGERSFMRLKEMVDEYLLSVDNDLMIHLELLGILPYDRKAVNLSEKHSVPIMIRQPNVKFAKNLKEICKRHFVIDKPRSEADEGKNILLRFRNFIGL